METRQVRRAAARMAAKIDRAKARIAARRQKRAAKKMSALGRHEATAYPESRYEGFRTTGKRYPRQSKRQSLRYAQLSGSTPIYDNVVGAV